MHILRAVAIAFSIYSKLPVPQFEWKEKDMRYMLCFFPWIGAVIGGCVWLWSLLCGQYGVGELCRTLFGTAIPLLITGGFHADGFMDTMDAFHSYQPREKKLEILKDSHIGAFSVLMLAVYGCIYVGAFSEITDRGLLRIVCCGFFLSRCLSGISVVCFPSAKKDGLLHLFADSSKKNIVRAVLLAQAVICAGVMLWQSLIQGILVTAAALLSFVYYYYRTKKELLGVSGDTAGYFVLLCEGSMMLTAAVINISAGGKVCGL